MIVDCHVHSWRYPEHFNKEAMLWNQPARRRSWPDEKFKVMWDQPVEDYLKVAEGVVDHALLMGFKSWNTFGVDVPNDYNAELARKYPDKLSMTASVIPNEKGAAQEVERCVKELGAVAIGELGSAYGGYYANDPECYPAYEKAAELDVPLIFHAGPSTPKMLRMKQADVLAIDDIAIDFPELRIVIPHIGWYKFEDASFLMQKHENVFADISWLVSLVGIDRRAISKYHPVVPYPYFNWVYPLLYCLSQTFGGTDKLIFGTDWTAMEPKNLINALENVNDLTRQMNLPEIPEHTIHNIIHENWKKIFTKLADRLGTRWGDGR